MCVNKHFEVPVITNKHMLNLRYEVFPVQVEPISRS